MRSLVLLASFLVSTHAFAGLTPGSELILGWKAWRSIVASGGERMPMKEVALASTFIGYVEGTLDYLQDTKQACAEGKSRKQVVQAVGEYFDSNEEAVKGAASFMVALALISAFPCPEPTFP